MDLTLFCIKGRFMKEDKERCLDCEAKSHWARLQELNLNDVKESLNKMQDALIWILENTDYPVGEE